MSATIVKCKILDKEWLRRQSNREEIELEIVKARRLQSKGLVQIMEECNDCRLKIHPEYSTKVMMASKESYLTKTAYGSKKKFKISWVQDHSKDGGAELSNRHLVQIGESLGFEIAGITPSNFHNTVLFDADLIVINNFFEFPPERVTAVLTAIYEKRIPFIKYDHDHREMKRPYFSRQLFTLSKRNIFISPLHQEKTAIALGTQILNHSICLPLSIDTKMYNKIKGIKRKENSVIIPCYRKCGKNVDEYIKANTKKEYLLIGNCSTAFDKSIKIEHRLNQAAELMPKLFSEYETMLHLPFSFWAGERIFFEAMLCGCKPIVNENVGHLSWKYNEDIYKQELEKAPFTFWKEVEKCLMEK